MGSPVKRPVAGIPEAEKAVSRLWPVVVCGVPAVKPECHLNLMQLSFSRCAALCYRGILWGKGFPMQARIFAQNRDRLMRVPRHELVQL